MDVCLLMPVFEIEINIQNVDELAFIYLQVQIFRNACVRGHCLDLVIFSTSSKTILIPVFQHNMIILEI